MAYGDDVNEGYGEGEEVLHFHYNREERLKRSPKIVRDYYNGTGIKFTKGIFRCLVATKLNRIMLFTVAMCMVCVFFVYTFGAKSNISVIAGYEAELTAFSYDDEVYASVKLHPLKETLKEGKLSGVADAEFLYFDADGEIVNTQESSCIMSREKSFLRTKTRDYDIIEVRAAINKDGESVMLKTKVERKN